MNLFFLQICIAFLLHLGDVTIPKSTDESRILENIKSIEVKLSAEEIDRLKTLDKNLRINTYDWLFRPDMDTVTSAWDVKEDETFVLSK